MAILIPSPLNHYPRISAVTPADWSNYSDANIKKAECEKQASVALRSVIGGVIEQTCNDLLTQCRTVDLALKKRVEECFNAKERLTIHLEQVIYWVGLHSMNVRG